MSYKLYYSPGACSMAVHAVLNEMQQTVDLVKVDIMGSKSPALTSVNPRGQVPVLVTPNGQTMLEGGAMMIWLCDQHQSPLMPTSGAERATALQWLMTANASLHPAYAMVFMLKGMNAPVEIMAAAQARINKYWAEIEQQLATTNAYICGSQMTVADILLTVIANWNGYLPTPVTFGPHCQRLFKTVTSRDSFKRAMEAEQVEYKAAA